MSHLEKAVHEHFARLQNAPGAATTNGTTVPSQAPTLATENSISDAGTLVTPFAKVNSVEPRSPADQAGLKTGDNIRGFGAVHWLNHERLSKVAEAVQQNEGVSLAPTNPPHTDHSVSDFFPSAHCRSKSRERTKAERAPLSSIFSSSLGAIGVAGVC